MAHVDDTRPRTPEPTHSGHGKRKREGWRFLPEWKDWAEKCHDVVWRAPTDAEQTRAPLYALMAMRRETVVPALLLVLYKQGYGNVPKEIIGYVCDYSSWWCAGDCWHSDEGDRALSAAMHMRIPRDTFDFPSACTECNGLFCPHPEGHARKCAVCAKDVCSMCAYSKVRRAKCAKCSRGLVLCRDHTTPTLACLCSDGKPRHLCRSCLNGSTKNGQCRTCRQDICGCDGTCRIHTTDRVCRTRVMMVDGGLMTMGLFTRYAWQVAYDHTHKQ